MAFSLAVGDTVHLDSQDEALATRVTLVDEMAGLVLLERPSSKGESVTEFFLSEQLGHAVKEGRARIVKRCTSKSSLNTTEDYCQEKGRLLRAARSFEPGELVLSEPPLMPIDTERLSALYSKEIVEALVFVESDFGPQLLFPVLQFVESSLETQLSLLDLFCPRPSIVPPQLFQSLTKIAETLLKSLPHIERRLQPLITVIEKEMLFSEEWKESKDSLYVTILRRVGLITSANMFGVSDGFTAFFKRASLINHSCLPNCNWSLEGGSMEIRAITHISQGEELTHSYFLQERWMPVTSRQAVLLDSKFFLCACQRCKMPDKTRGFACRECSQGVFYISGEGEEDYALPCNRCGFRETSADFLSSIIAKETNLGEAVEELQANFEQIQSSREVLDLYQKCQRAGMHTSSHYILAMLHDLLHDLYKLDFDFLRAAWHIRQRVVYLEQSYPRPANITAWSFEYLGDDIAALCGVPPKLLFSEEYLHAASQSGKIMPEKETLDTKHKLTIDSALEAYQCAEKMLKILYGPSHEYILDIERKREAISRYFRKD